jgi:hypothetical protein
MRSLLLTMLFAMAALPAHGVERWETLPPTPTPIPAERSGHVIDPARALLADGDGGPCGLS